MKKARTLAVVAGLSLSMVLGVMPATVFAETNTAEFKDQQPEVKKSVTLNYRYENTAGENVSKQYTVSADSWFNYQPTDMKIPAGKVLVGWTASEGGAKLAATDDPFASLVLYPVFADVETPGGEVAVPQTKEKTKRKKKKANLPQTGDPVFVITSAASLTGIAATAVSMYMTKRRK